MNLDELPKLLRMSKSLVFVPDKFTGKLVANVAYNLGVPYRLSRDYIDGVSLEDQNDHFAVIAQLPALVTGWRSSAEQVIWIGPVPEVGSDAYAVYCQAINRTARIGAPHVVHHLDNTGAVQ